MPNSVLWIGLVVLWVFVLFPILADRHPRIRRTTDAALATRVLHRGGSKRRIRIRAAGGHDSDPDYRPRVLSKRPHPDDSEDRMTPSADDPTNDLDDEKHTTDVELDTAAPAAPDDTDDGDNAADLETPAAEADPAGADEAPAEPVAATAARVPPAASPPALLDDIDTATATATATAAATAGATLDDDDFVPSRRGRGGYDPEADAIARAARYTFRQRAVLGLIIGATLFAVFGFLLNPMFWWAFGLALAVLGGYLAYLRRQVRVEEDIRRRRAARLVRKQRQGEPAVTPEAATARRTMDRDTARALRRRSTLLDTDDEDPVFEYLDAFDPATARALRSKVGDMRRAVGE
ncbi:gephyrin-like molybdotransferase receptor GlpR [Nocardia thailandica]|uniref:Gephyrin-like molybdotransferase receptor GlpR n=1 Tax=Nocardia thailandica TaxID=257275 RepID=A0ABW6PW30_9NOCA